MKQTFDTDTILFKTLSASESIVSAISGGIHKRQRPLNSELEDIVVNTIALSQEYYPQIGTSNINIHVPDKNISIDGVKQKMPDNDRMEELSSLVLETIRSASFDGISASIESQTVIPESEIKQHFVNVRITWNIHK